MTFLDSEKWEAKGTLVFTAGGTSVPPKKIPGNLSGQALQTTTISTSTDTKEVKASWRYAGTLFAADFLNGIEFAREVIRINTTQVIQWKTDLLPPSYQVAFQPFSWLPNCRFSLFEYTGPILKGGDLVKSFVLRGGETTEEAGVFTTLFELRTGLRNRDFAVVGVFERGITDLRVECLEERFGEDGVRIVTVTGYPPRDGDFVAIIVAASEVI